MARSRSRSRSDSRSRGRSGKKRSRDSRSRDVSKSPRKRSDDRSRSKSPKRRASPSASPKRRRSPSASPKRRRSPSQSPKRRNRSGSRERRRSRSDSGGRGRDRKSRRSHSPPRARALAIFNLSYKTTEDTLSRYFERYGKVENCNIVCNRRRGQTTGFGFVTFENKDDACEAKNDANETELDGRLIRTDYCESKGAHRSTPGRYMGRKDQRFRSRSPRGRGGGYRGGRSRSRDRYDRRSPRGRRSRSPDYRSSRRTPDYRSSRRSPSPYRRRSRSR